MIYGCYNNPHRVVGGEYMVQDGWEYFTDSATGGMTRRPRIVKHQDVMSLPCAYDKSGVDPGSAGCKRAQPARGSQVAPAMGLASKPTT